MGGVSKGHGILVDQYADRIIPWWKSSASRADRQGMVKGDLVYPPNERDFLCLVEAGLAIPICDTSHSNGEVVEIRG